MINKKDLSKIGIGTWGIGGLMEPDPNNDDQKQINAIVYALQKDINYVETVYMYAKGKAVDLLSKAIIKSEVNREKIFITLSVYQSDAKSTNDVEDKINNFLNTLGTNYVDSVQFTMGLVRDLDLNLVKKLVDKLIDQGKTRFTSLTNSNLEYLEKYYETFGDKLFAHESCFNFEVRENEQQGITKFADSHDILNVVYQPLRRNKTAQKNWPPLVQLAEKYHKTQNQIILNWIVSKGFFPLNKTSNTEHVNENLEAFKFTIDKEDLELLNNFKIPNYSSPKIDWFDTGDGIKIHQLPNVFDEIYKG
ncbi:MAG: aldo/keto reductase [bacterium]|nr:aldo/keto reductase [bacterium]